VTRGRRLGMLSAVLYPVLRGLFALSLAALSSSCSSGTETGNPSFQAELSYTAYSSAPQSIGVRDAGSEVVVDSVWLDLDTVALVGAGRCVEPEPEVVSVPALGIGDHASGQHNATRFELPRGEYCALDLPFVLAPHEQIQAGVPEDLERHSIMLAGSLADGTPFTLLSAATPTVRLGADAGSFELNARQAETLITFDVAIWLADLDWASATRVGGAIGISAQQNPALLARFESNLARGIALYRDANGDGKLDDVRVRLAHGE
jgi:hypothetical protein